MKLKSRRSFYQVAGLIGLDGLLFCTTDVTKVPSIVVMIGFLLLALTLYQLVRAIFKLGRLYGLNFKRQRSLALYATGILAGLLALQSIGQLSRRDILVLLPLVIIGYLYTAYLKTARRNLSG